MSFPPNSALLISEKESEKRVQQLLAEWDSEFAPQEQSASAKKPKRKAAYLPQPPAKHIQLKAAQ